MAEFGCLDVSSLDISQNVDVLVYESFQGGLWWKWNSLWLVLQKQTFLVDSLGRRDGSDPVYC